MPGGAGYVIDGFISQFIMVMGAVGAIIFLVRIYPMIFNAEVGLDTETALQYMVESMVLGAVVSLILTPIMQACSGFRR